MPPALNSVAWQSELSEEARPLDGKDYFTIFDFVKAYEHFSDPEWDGEPLEPEPSSEPRLKSEPPPSPVLVDPVEAPGEKLVIKLADGKERTFQHISGTTFWDASGKPISAQQFVEQLFGKLPELFRNEEELRRIWSDPDTRKALVEGLAERGFAGEQLTQIRRMIDAEASDLFDVLRYIAFTKAPLKRAERVQAHRSDILSDCDPKQAEFLDFVLSQYVSEGEGELDPEKLPRLLNVKYGSATDALQHLGVGVREVHDAFRALQNKLYYDVPSRSEGTTQSS